MFWEELLLVCHKSQRCATLHQGFLHSEATWATCSSLKFKRTKLVSSAFEWLSVESGEHKLFCLCDAWWPWGLLSSLPVSTVFPFTYCEHLPTCWPSTQKSSSLVVVKPLRTVSSWKLETQYNLLLHPQLPSTSSAVSQATVQALPEDPHHIPSTHMVASTHL